MGKQWKQCQTLVLGQRTDSNCQSQRRKDWEFKISKYKLLYIKLINNKFLLCSTENYIQYLAINHNGKKMKNVYIYTERER